jgi:1-acyl-sn-glycerol-3-phosphate acyltransferase
MQLDEFWDELRRTGSYETPGDCCRGLYGRLLSSWSDFFFYMDIVRVVISARLQANRGAFDRKAWAGHSFKMLRVDERCGAKVSFSGFENLAGIKLPVVYTANHMSMVETLLLPGALLAFGDVATVVKESLMTYPLFGRVMRCTEPISVNRRDPREDLKQVLTKGEAFLRAGRSVLIFPQATRAIEFDPADFNSLGVKLARNAGVQVVPVALQTDFQGIGRWIRDFGPLRRKRPIRFKVGKALSIEGAGRATQDAVVRFICDTLRSWDVKVKDPAP